MKSAGKKAAKQTMPPRNEVSESDYLAEVNRLLDEQYGVSTDDVGTDSAFTARIGGLSPQEHVDWLADKYGLERIDTV